MKPITHQLVFVYGSLMNGFGNHRILACQKFVGNARIESDDNGKSFTMHAYTHSFPAIYEDETMRQKSSIDGEVYKVDVETFVDLDCLESHPYWYVREQVQVRLDDGHTVDAWVYVMRHDKVQGEEIKNGSWRSYRSELSA